MAVSVTVGGVMSLDKVDEVAIVVVVEVVVVVVDVVVVELVVVAAGRVVVVATAMVDAGGVAASPHVNSGRSPASASVLAEGFSKRHRSTRLLNR